MKKKIGLYIISLALVFTVFNPIKIYASTPIIYSEHASDISSLEREDIVGSSGLEYDMTLNPGDVWKPRDTSTIEELLFAEPSKFGFTYYNYEIYYMDNTMERFFDTEVSYEELVSKSTKEIKEVAFFYSYAGMLTINYKLDSIDGLDLKPSEELLGRVGYVHEDVSEIENLPDEVQLADRFNIDTTLDGYHVKQVIGELQGEYVYDNKITTIIYEKDAPAKANVSFDYNDGITPTENIDVNLNDTVVEPANPTRDGYTFNGWFTEIENGSKFDFSTPITSNITLYAHWSKDIIVEDKYTVNFESNGGTAILPLKDIVKGSTINEPNTPTKAGYTFNGWFKDIELTSPWNFSTDTINSNVTLYAKWTKDKVVEDKYTVNFESNGGTTVQPLKDIVKGSTINEPNAPTKAGYTFKGWFIDKDFKNSWNFQNDQVHSNITLYAKWENIPPVKTTEDTNTPKTGILQSTSFYLSALSASMIALYNATSKLAKNKKKDNY